MLTSSWPATRFASPRVEDHELIERRLRGKPLTPTAVTLGPERYQLSIEKAVLLKVVEELAGRLNLTIRWDRAAIETAGLSAEQLVTVQVQDADLDELLGAVLTGTGLTFQRQDLRSHHPTTGWRRSRRTAESLNRSTKRCAASNRGGLGQSLFQLLTHRLLDLAFEHHGRKRQRAIDHDRIRRDIQVALNGKTVGGKAVAQAVPVPLFFQVADFVSVGAP